MENLTPDTAPKFKVGDWVVVENHASGAGLYSIGFFTQIIEYTQGAYKGHGEPKDGVKTNPVVPESNQSRGLWDGYLGVDTFRKATPEDFLVEAKRRYPKGTIRRSDPPSFSYSQEVEVEDPNKFTIHTIPGNCFFFIHAEPGKGILYSSLLNEWAEIVEHPSQEKELNSATETKKKSYITKSIAYLEENLDEVKFEENRLKLLNEFKDRISILKSKIDI